MSDDYVDQIRRIRQAGSLQEIQAIVREYPAKAVGEGGYLYSRPVGDVSSETIALEMAARTNEPIINHTPRAQFLSNRQVSDAIAETAEGIMVRNGQPLHSAGTAASEFLYGSPKALANSPTSLEGCLWGEASKEFAGSLRGDVKVIATQANIERVFGKVELPTVLENPNVRTLGGQAIADLKTVHAQGGASAVLPRVQAAFVDAVPKGVFIPQAQLGGDITTVRISREAAAALGADAAAFESTSELAARGMVRAPTGITGAVAPVAALDAGIASGTAAAEAAARGVRPSMLARGGTALAVAAVAYDFATTGHDVVRLQSQGNQTGADSAKTHFVGRNVGGIGGGIALGFLSGAGYGLIAGSETGPGALITGGIGGIVGGVGGAFMGERWAREEDIKRVYTQKDADGNEWTRDPEDPKRTWSRTADTQQLAGGATQSDPAYRNVRYVAGDRLANELNYHSANASYELGLAKLSDPVDPYRQSAGRGDTPSMGGHADWVRNAGTGTWHREVVTDVLEHGIRVSHAETASPERAAALDQQARVRIAENAMNTPPALAARYEVAYRQFGWDKQWPVPEAIQKAAADTHSLRASDGLDYQLQSNGEWTTPGRIYGVNQAEGNLRDELNAVHASQQQGVHDLQGLALQAKANPILPEANALRGLVASTYEAAGIERTAAQLDAATAAIEKTHAASGLDKAGRPFTLTLQPDPATGRVGAGSAIVTMMDDGRDGIFSDSRMVPRAVTSAAEIQAAGHVPAVTGQPEAALQPGVSAANRALFDRIRGEVPAHVPDEVVAQAMLKAKEAGINDAGRVERALVSEDRLWVMGDVPGFRVAVDLASAAPPLKEVFDRADRLDQEQVAQAQQREQQGPRLPV